MIVTCMGLFMANSNKVGLAILRTYVEHENITACMQ